MGLNYMSSRFIGSLAFVVVCLLVYIFTLVVGREYTKAAHTLAAEECSKLNNVLWNQASVNESSDPETCVKQILQQWNY